MVLAFLSAVIFGLASGVMKALAARTMMDVAAARARITALPDGKIAPVTNEPTAAAALATDIVTLQASPFVDRTAPTHRMDSDRATHRTTETSAAAAMAVIGITLLDDDTKAPADTAMDSSRAFNPLATTAAAVVTALAIDAERAPTTDAAATIVADVPTALTIPTVEPAGTDAACPARFDIETTADEAICLAVETTFQIPSPEATAAADIFPADLADATLAPIATDACLPALLSPLAAVTAVMALDAATALISASAPLLAMDALLPARRTAPSVVADARAVRFPTDRAAARLDALVTVIDRTAAFAAAMALDAAIDARLLAERPSDNAAATDADAECAARFAVARALVDVIDSACDKDRLADAASGADASGAAPSIRRTSPRW